MLTKSVAIWSRQQNRMLVSSPSYYLVHDEIPLAMASSAAAVKGRFR